MPRIAPEVEAGGEAALAGKTLRHLGPWEVRNLGAIADREAAGDRIEKQIESGI